MSEYQNKNAAAVLGEVNALLEEAEKWKKSASACFYGGRKSWPIAEVCDRLSIFDWWPERLSVSQLQKMKEFLEKAIALGFTGYVCFKVGAAGCAHGMWAHRQETTTGYSPDGACLFRGFRSGSYGEWDWKDETGAWLDEKTGDGQYRTFSSREVKASVEDYYKKWAENEQRMLGVC